MSTSISRRAVLRGALGAVVALPLLEGLKGVAPAQAGGAPQNSFAIFMRCGNGVQQLVTSAGEPETFFPTAYGPLTTATLADRAVARLAPYAARMSIVHGLNYPDSFMDSGCGHSTAGNICLTATPPFDHSGNKSLASGESIDNRIARELSPGVEPLTLYAGRKGGYLDEVLSYRGSQQLRAAENNPYNAYVRLFGLPSASAAEQMRLLAQRKSVNDLVRSQMQDLLARPDLSKSDRDRLDLHFTSIRDLENQLSCSLPSMEVDSMNALTAMVENDDYIVQMAQFQCDILALAVACGMAKASTIQIGNGNDGTQYTIGGVKLPSYHQISHRIYSDGSMGAPIPNAVDLHHQIDVLHMDMFKYLLDKLDGYPAPPGSSGTLLDQGVTVWLNDLKDGEHERHDIPYVLVGGCGGALKTGSFVDAGGVTTNLILNTIGAAVGCKNGMGGPLDDFGDATLTKGRVDALVA